MKRIIKLPNYLKVKYEIEGAGNINAGAIIQTLLETEGITKKKDNVIPSISNLLVDGHPVEGAFYDMKEHSIELELNDRPYNYCKKCGRHYNDYPIISKKDGSEICPTCAMKEEKDYSYHNAQAVLDKVEEKIAYLKTQYRGAKFRMDDVYDELSIFDWWTDELGISRLEDMRKFLREAIKLGYTGYVCFKVGMSGCANGMWAHKKESTDGYSPDGPTLYKSFTPDYEYWSVMDDDKDYLPREEYNKLKTIKMLEDFMKEVGLYE